MDHTKAKGTSKLGRDSRPQYLGNKIADGQKVKTGMIIIRQRGMKFLAGKNVGIGKDYTLFALKQGTVKFRTKKKKNFNNSQRIVKKVDVEI